jgi:hypothetical protein
VRIAAVGLALALALGVTACSNDADDDVAIETTVVDGDTATPATTGSAATDATGADDGASTSAVATADPELCAAFTGLSQLDAAVGPLTNDFPALQAAVLDLADDLATTYSRVLALVPEELRADVQLVADFTTQSFEVIAAAPDLETATAELVALPGAEEAAGAAVRIDDYSVDACGVSISGS